MTTKAAAVFQWRNAARRRQSSRASMDAEEAKRARYEATKDVQIGLQVQVRFP